MLRDKYETADFHEWPEYQTPSHVCIVFCYGLVYVVKDDIEKIVSEHKEAVGFFYYTQFHLDRQLRNASKYVIVEES